jgi:two-component system sensor histidine kinase UhpB
MLRSSRVNINQIYSASRTGEACDLIHEYLIDLVLLDLSLPDSFGIDSFLRIKPLVLSIPVIILTGLNESEVAFEALQQGAQDYLVKGEFKADLLAKSIQYSLERKIAEKKISQSEEKYRQLFYKNPFPAWIYDPEDQQILEVNDAAIRKYGYERKEFLTLTLAKIRSAEIYPELKEEETDHDNGNRRHKKLWHHLKKNGETITVEITFFQVDYSGKPAMQVQINDVTEKLNLEKEVLKQQKLKQQQIAEAILNAQDEERKTLGKELHDNISQILATAKLFLTTGMVEKELLPALVSQSQSYITMAIDEIRKLSKVLITPVFIESGLKQAIEGLVKDIQIAKKIRISTAIEAIANLSLSKLHKITIYRIIQEQLNNILKYAGATRVDIGISIADERLVLLVADNGIGFDTALARNGIGLINIKSRAELCNGKMEIDSSPGNGCRLKVEMNINNSASQKAA